MGIATFKADQLRIANPGTDWLVLSLIQPWAQALFIPGLKRIETRPWRTNYRGRIYIHGSKGFPKKAKAFFAAEVEAERLAWDANLPLGAIIGHVDLVDIKRAADLVPSISDIEYWYGDYSPGRWGWITENPVLLPEPIPAKGQLGLWKFTPAVRQ
jgi:activating signal cointegrator 1